MTDKPKRPTAGRPPTKKHSAGRHNFYISNEVYLYLSRGINASFELERIVRQQPDYYAVISDPTGQTRPR